MEEYFEPAAPRDRLIAGAIDLGMATAVLLILRAMGWPFFGFIVSTAYILLRDGFDGRSLGKRLRKLRCIELTSERPCDYKTSCLRSLLLSPPILGLAVGIYEYYRSLQDSDYRRYGDHFANTLVIREASLHSSES